MTAVVCLGWRREMGVPEAGRGAPGVLRGREGVLQRGTGDDDGGYAEGVRGGRVVREPPLLPGQPLRPGGGGRPGGEVSQEVRPALLHHGDPRPQARRDRPPSEEEGPCQGQGQEVVIPIDPVVSCSLCWFGLIRMACRHLSTDICLNANIS